MQLYLSIITIPASYQQLCVLHIYISYNISACIFQMKKEDFKDVSSKSEAAANTFWMLSNSKKCPTCKSPIEKNEGCNHMRCSKVSDMFRFIELLALTWKDWVSLFIVYHLYLMCKLLAIQYNNTTVCVVECIESNHEKFKKHGWL